MIQLPAKNPAEVPNAKAGTQVLFRDTNGDLRLKDENGNVKHLNEDERIEFNKYKYIMADTSTSVETEGTRRIYWTAEGKFVDIYEGGQWVNLISGAPS